MPSAWSTAWWKHLAREESSNHEAGFCLPKKDQAMTDRTRTALLAFGSGLAVAAVTVATILWVTNDMRWMLLLGSVGLSLSETDPQDSGLARRASEVRQERFGCWVQGTTCLRRAWRSASRLRQRFGAS